MEVDEILEILEKLIEEQSVELWQIFVIFLEDDDIFFKDSFMVIIIEIVKKILEKQMFNNFVLEYNDDILYEEYEQIVFIICKDIDKVVFDIVSFIRKEFDIDERNGIFIGFKLEDIFDKIFCWQRVGSKVKVFFVQKFVKELILSFVINLRFKFDCIFLDIDNLKQLSQGVGSLVEDIILLEEDEEIRKDINEVCIY